MRLRLYPIYLLEMIHKENGFTNNFFCYIIKLINIIICYLMHDIDKFKRSALISYCRFFIVEEVLLCLILKSQSKHWLHP